MFVEVSLLSSAASGRMPFLPNKHHFILQRTTEMLAHSVTRETRFQLLIGSYQSALVHVRLIAHFPHRCHRVGDGCIGRPRPGERTSAFDWLEAAGASACWTSSRAPPRLSLRRRCLQRRSLREATQHSTRPSCHSFPTLSRRLRSGSATTSFTPGPQKLSG